MQVGLVHVKGQLRRIPSLARRHTSCTGASCICICITREDTDIISAEPEDLQGEVSSQAASCQSILERAQN